MTVTMSQLWGRHDLTDSHTKLVVTLGDSMRITSKHDGLIDVYGESNGRNIRQDSRDVTDVLPKPSTVSITVKVGNRTINAHEHKPTSLVPFQIDATDREHFRSDRMTDYAIMRKYHKLFSSDAHVTHVCCVFRKSNSCKHFIGMIVHDIRGIAYFSRSNDTMVFNTILDSGSNASIRKLLHISNDVHIYQQSIIECLKAYEHSIKNHNKRKMQGINASRPHDRQPQKFILKGRPIAPIKD